MGDGWLQYFPVGSMRHIRDLAEWAGQALDRLSELPLHPVGPHQPLVVRLLCLPTWSTACSVRIERSGLSWRLAARELDGEAGFDLGQLARREDRLLSTADAARLADLWGYLRFWSLPPVASEEDVFDGTSFVLEGAEHGRYHGVVRDDPEWGDTFGEFGELLVGLAGLAPR
jgi:hypothetical protein